MYVMMAGWGYRLPGACSIDADRWLSGWKGGKLTDRRSREVKFERRGNEDSYLYILL